MERDESGREIIKTKRGKTRYKRVCLGPGCDRRFTADSPYTRLCLSCRRLEQYGYLADARYQKS